MQPLTKATGGKDKKGKITWNDEMENAFIKLKAAMAKEVTLAYPDYSEGAEPLTIYTDASGNGMGSCLTQVQDGNLRMIAYASVAFNAAESNYSTIEKELAAIRWAVKSFRPFVFGVEFVINTDHRPLLYLYQSSTGKYEVSSYVERVE